MKSILASMVVIFVGFAVPSSARCDVFGLVRTIQNPDGGAGDEFGVALTPVGSDKVLIGAYQSDLSGTNAGAAYLFRTTGELLARIPNPDPDTQQFFGLRVASTNDYLMIGAWGEEKPGAAYLYDMSGTLLHTFLNPHTSEPTSFAFGMTAIGPDLLVTSMLDDTVGAARGAAFLVNGNGVLESTFYNPEPSDGRGFGRVVAAVGDDKFLVSSYRAQASGDITGVVYLMDRSGQLLHTFTNPNQSTGDRFGTSLAVVGDRILIGDVFDDTAGTDSGAAYLFDQDGKLFASFFNPTPQPMDLFGLSIASVGSHIAVAAHEDDTAAPGAGAVYVFSTDGLLEQTILNPTPGPDLEHFGYLASSGADLFVGTHFEGGTQGPGAVYVYAEVSEPSSVALGLAAILVAFALRMRRRTTLD